MPGQSQHPSIIIEDVPGYSPGYCLNVPWMYIKYHRDGRKVTYDFPPYVGYFHYVPPSLGGILCRGACLPDSECEMRVRRFFDNAAFDLDWKGNDLEDMVVTVIEAIEAGVLDRFGIPIDDEPGQQLGYSERYRGW